jgi:hypothetical protein
MVDLNPDFFCAFPLTEYSQGYRLRSFSRITAIVLGLPWKQDFAGLADNHPTY